VLPARNESVVAQFRPGRMHSHGVLHRQEKFSTPGRRGGKALFGRRVRTRRLAAEVRMVWNG